MLLNSSRCAGLVARIAARPRATYATLNARLGAAPRGCRRKRGRATGIPGAVHLRWKSDSAFNRAVEKMSPDTSKVGSEGVLNAATPLLPYMVLAGGLLAAVAGYKHFSSSKPTRIAADDALNTVQASQQVKHLLGDSGGVAIPGNVRSDEKTRQDFDHESVGFPAPLPEKWSYFEVSFLATLSGDESPSPKSITGGQAKDVKITSRGIFSPEKGENSWCALHTFAKFRDGTIVTLLDRRADGYTAAQNTVADKNQSPTGTEIEPVPENEPLFNLEGQTYLGWVVAGVVLGVSIGALVIRIRRGSGGSAAAPSSAGRALLKMASADIATCKTAQAKLGVPIKSKDFFLYGGSDSSSNARITRLTGSFKFELSGPAGAGVADV